MESSERRTAEWKHRAKDGRWYDTYMNMVAANRRFNENVLKEKGLHGAILSKRTDQTGAQARRVKRKAETEEVAPVRRISRRIGKKKPEFTPTLDDTDADGHAVSEEAAVNVQVKRPIQRRRTDHTSVALTEEDIVKLGEYNQRHGDEWVQTMESWLTTVPHGDGNQKVVSRENARSVMKQIRLLVAGDGITYHHWPDGTYFCQNRRLSLADNVTSLYDQAVEMENMHGRDRGNGWLMRHPLRKLELFQRYILAIDNQE